MSEQLSIKVQWFLRGLYENEGSKVTRKIAFALLKEIEAEKVMN